MLEGLLGGALEGVGLGVYGEALGSPLRQWVPAAELPEGFVRIDSVPLAAALQNGQREFSQLEIDRLPLLRCQGDHGYRVGVCTGDGHWYLPQQMSGEHLLWHVLGVTRADIDTGLFCLFGVEWSWLACSHSVPVVARVPLPALRPSPEDMAVLEPRVAAVRVALDGLGEGLDEGPVGSACVKLLESIRELVCGRRSAV